MQILRSNKVPARRFILTGLVFALGLAAASAQDAAKPSSPYQPGPKTRDGIGKYYHGREIAHYMSHAGAPWLERPERAQEERPDLVMKALGLKPGQVVADVGCGTGYYSRRLAEAVGPKGVVYGVEIQPEMLALLATKMKERGVTNVVGVLGTPTDPKFPRSVDLAIMVDVYHEMDHPFEVISAMCRQLKPGGRLVFVEYRGEDPEVPIKPLHKMTEAQVKKEMAGQPLEYVETVRNLPWQHVIIFRKQAEK